MDSVHRPFQGAALLDSIASLVVNARIPRLFLLDRCPIRQLETSRFSLRLPHDSRSRYLPDTFSLNSGRTFYPAVSFQDDTLSNLAAKSIENSEVFPN